MMEKTEKRIRNPNFMEDEKEILVDLVKKYFSVIENKKTDAASQKEKNNQWQIIAAEFNSQVDYYYRSWESLKLAWENQKKLAKKLFAEMKTNPTGWGHQKRKKIDPVLLRINDIIRPSIENNFNPYDNDNEIDSIGVIEESQIFIKNEEINEPSLNQMEDSDMTVDDWSSYTPSHLEQPIYPIVKVKETCNEEQNSKANEPVPNIPNSRTSRRRPRLTTNAHKKLLDVYKAKINVLDEMKEYQIEERSMMKQILSLKKEQEEEKLKQEKIRTQLLEIELRKATDNLS